MNILESKITGCGYPLTIRDAILHWVSDCVPETAIEGYSSEEDEQKCTMYDVICYKFDIYILMNILLKKHTPKQLIQSLCVKTFIRKFVSK